MKIITPSFFLTIGKLIQTTMDWIAN